MTDEERKAKKKEWDRIRYLKNKEQILERNRRWQAENREKFRETKKRWYERNKEEVQARSREKYWADVERFRKAARESMRKWRLANPDKYREHVANYKRWREANREQFKQQRRKYYALHHDAVLEQKRKWRRLNPDKIRGYERKRAEKRRNESARRRLEKQAERRVLFESRLQNVPKRIVLERIYDLLEWRGLWRSLR